MKTSISLAVAMAGISTVGIAQTVRDLDSHEHGSAVLNVAVDTNALFLELDTPWDNLVGFEHNPGTEEQLTQVTDALALLNEPDRVFLLDGGNCVATRVVTQSTMPTEEFGDDHKDDDHDDHKDDDHDDHKDDDHDDHKDDDHDDHKDADHDDHKDDDHDDHKDDDHDDHKDDDHDTHKDDDHDDHKDDDHDDHKDDDHKNDAHDDDEHHAHEDDDQHAHEDDSQTHRTALVSYSYSCDNIDQLSSITVNVFSLWPGFEELNVQLIGPGGQTLMKLGSDQPVLGITDVQ